MAKEGGTRKLAAILATDVVGYSRLMSADEAGTLARMTAHLDEIFKPAISEHQGHVVKTTGDGLLAEFSSAVEAVECAVQIQTSMAERDKNDPEDRRVTFRIGINLGDIIIQDGDIFGDGVNVAARIEALADPGGVFISQSVADQIAGKIDTPLEDLGKHEVKNIPRPVHVFRMLLDGAEPGQPLPKAMKSKPQSRNGVLAAAVLVAAGVAAVVLWPSPPPPVVTTASQEKTAQVLSDKPSVAVLPFVNMSGDKKQEYFSDGLTEDLITDISKVSGLRVIARNSTFSYKGKSPDVREVGKDLGASHVIEGSVRKAGGTVRITVQLISAADGSHVWAERYDRELKDIFAVQDEVIGKIIAILSIKLTSEEKTRIAHYETDNLEAYDLLKRGRQQESFFTPAANAQAVEFYKRAIALDPKYAKAYAHLSILKGIIATFGKVENIEKSHAEALKYAEMAVALDPSLPLAHFALGRILSRPKIAEYPRAIETFRKAIRLDPNYADGYANLAFVSIFTGDADGAQGYIETAMQMNPHYPFWYLFARSMARYFKGDYQGAVEDLTIAAERNSTVVFVRYWLAAALAQAGEIEEARWAVEEFRGIGNTDTLDEILKKNPITFPGYKEKLGEGLKKAGFK